MFITLDDVIYAAAIESLTIYMLKYKKKHFIAIIRLDEDIMNKSARVSTIFRF